MELKRVVVGLLQTNTYILSSNKEGLIIDPGAESDKIRALIQGIFIKYIILSHNHPDHIGGVESLKDELKLISDNQNGGCKQGVSPCLCGIHTLDKTEEADFEFKDGDEIKFGEQTLKVIHTPGHTPGGCCFLWAGTPSPPTPTLPLARNSSWMYRNVPILLSGDTLFFCGYGRTDLPGGDETKLFKSIEKILKLPPDTKVYPGHGPSTTIANERKFY